MGFKKAKEQGAYKGRGVDQDRHQRILECLGKGMGIREAARARGVSTATVQRAIKIGARRSKVTLDDTLFA